MASEIPGKDMKEAMKRQQEEEARIAAIQDAALDAIRAKCDAERQAEASR